MSHKNTRTGTLAQWLENVHLKDVIRQFRYMLGLSPVCEILNRIRQHGIDLSQVSAIELFGGTGSMFTREIAANVSDLNNRTKLSPDVGHAVFWPKQYQCVFRSSRGLAQYYLVSQRVSSYIHTVNGG